MTYAPGFDLNTLNGLPKSGIVGWLLGRFHGAERPRPVLTVLERVTLAPRQSLTLIEAEGRKILVATSPECAPTFFPLERTAGNESHSRRFRPTPMHTVPVRGIVC